MDSDVFTLARTDSIIPALTNVPLTPEERRRRVVVRISATVFVLVCLATAAGIVLFLRHRSSVRATALAAGDDGRAASLARALDTIGDSGSAERVALRARLEAMGALEQGDAAAAKEARTLLASLQPSDRTLLDAAVASTYLALYDSDLTTARRFGSSLVPAGDYAAEASHARASTALAVGNLGEALRSARAAVAARPGAPRYAALLARVLARTGKNAEAERVLSKAGHSPAARIVHGRVHLARGDDTQAVRDAHAVLADTNATAPERAWAHLVIARADARNGAVHDAQAAIGAIGKAHPPGDEAFDLGLAEADLAIGDDDAARTVLEARPKGGTSDAARRARAVAWLDLDQGQVDAAASVLRSGGRGLAEHLLEGRLDEARHQSDAARAAYEAAAADPTLAVEAARRIASLELGRGHARDAVQWADRALAGHANDLPTVPVAVRAHLAANDAAGAARIVQAALAAHPGEGTLLAARSLVEVQEQSWAKARATLQKAIAKLPRDADLHARLGDVARHLGDTNGARAAYDAAIHLAPHHPDALLGRLEIALDAEDVDTAQAMLAKIDEAHLDSGPILHARARFLVLTDAGAHGLRILRHAMRHVHPDADLWRAYGLLYAQAEDWGNAARSFAKVLDDLPNDVEALLDQGIARERLRILRPAQDAIDAARDAAQAAHLGAGVRARITAAEGSLRFAFHLLGPAHTLARQAVALDANCGDAHLLLADIATKRDADPTSELRAALRDTPAPPEAMARLASSLDPGDEQCKLARGYLEAAPGGHYAHSMRHIASQCH